MKALLTILVVSMSFSLKAQTSLVKIKLKNHFENLIKVDTVKMERDTLKLVEQSANKDGQKILETGRIMAMEEQKVVRGSCWTYINAIFTRAGYAQNKHKVYQSKKTGPYADSKLIKAGDWLYYVNHSFHNVGHSGIFVKWIDRSKHIALILSYVGRSKKKPGRYKTYKIDNVYHITRAGSM